MFAPLALATFLAAAPGPHALLARGQAGTDAIGPAAISAHIRFLADDLLEGRAPGSRGHAIGEAYVATQLAALGIAPAGENGTYFQDVPLRAWTVDRAASRLTLSARGGAVPLESEKDYLLLSDGDVSRVDLTAPLAFAGYGVTAPEYGWDDLAGVDLRGKIAVVLASAPGPGDARFFPGVAHAVAADTRAKLERLRARGATFAYDGIVAHGEGAQSGGIFFEDPDGTRLEIYAANAGTAVNAPVSGAPTCGFF